MDTVEKLKAYFKAKLTSVDEHLTSLEFRITVGGLLEYLEIREQEILRLRRQQVEQGKAMQAMAKFVGEKLGAMTEMLTTTATDTTQAPPLPADATTSTAPTPPPLPFATSAPLPAAPAIPEADGDDDKPQVIPNMTRVVSTGPVMAQISATPPVMTPIGQPPAPPAPVPTPSNGAKS